MSMLSIDDIRSAVESAGIAVEDENVVEGTVLVSVPPEDSLTYDAICTQLWHTGAEVIVCNPYSFMSFVEFDQYLRDIAFDDEGIDTVFVLDMREGRAVDPTFMSSVDANLLEVREECAGLPISFVIVE